MFVSRHRLFSRFEEVQRRHRNGPVGIYVGRVIFLSVRSPGKSISVGTESSFSFPF